MIQRTIMLLGAWLLVTGTASAGGAYLPRSGTAESTSQRAVLILEGNTTTLLMQSGFSGTATELAWVVPVTGIGAAQQIDLGTPDAFERLHEQSAPQVVRLVEKRKSLGCSSEGVTFVTPTHIEPFNGLSATDASFFPLDAQLSTNVLDWLGGVSVGSVCPDLATSCTVDEDCGEPTVCQDGFCSNQVHVCGTDADCGADIECFENMCVDLTPTCGADSDCRAEVTCRNDVCMNLTPTCANDLDCGGGLEVNTCEGTVCTDGTTLCGSNADCPGPCQSNLCTDDATPCTTEKDCPKGETCPYTCVSGSENAGDDCGTHRDCGVQQCFPGTCADGEACGNDADCDGLRECRSGTCFFDTADPQRACATDADCAGLIECVDEYCEHGGHPCRTNADCGGFVECASHCANLEVSCSTDAECDMQCEDETCRDRGTVPAAERRVTQRACSRDLDCAAADECETLTINGADRTLCTNLAPYCSSGARCDETCQEHPVGSGVMTCGGSFSELSCTADGQCSASIECQQGMCVNLTRTCVSDGNCGTTCEKPDAGAGRYDLGIACDNDNDCSSGSCVRYQGSKACSRGCSLPGDPCPTRTAEISNGFDCVLANDVNTCWPRGGPVEPGRCGGSDFRCSVGGDCTAATECSSNRTPDPSYPLSTDQSAWLTQYADQGAKFAVTKLRGVASATGADLLPPLAIQLGGNVQVFPLRTIDGSTLDLELYVIAHERYEPANYASSEVLIDEFFTGGDFDEWYADRVEQNFTLAGEPTFLVEYADVIDLSLVDHVLGRSASIAQLGADEWFLTKLRVRLASADVTQDLQLRAAGTQRFVIRAMGSGAASEAAVPLGGFGVLLALGWVGWRIRRRARA